jgi:threonine synthase
VRLAGVNSINWARVLAQVVYYFTAAVSLGAPHRPVSFTVPTGNFGDIFAGYIAKRHGPADREAGRGHQPERHPAPGAVTGPITGPMA